MKAREIMTKDPACCTPGDTVQDAAMLMAERDCGCLPVVDDTRKVIGTVTDRDIACRCTAQGKGPQTQVREAMSNEASCCGPEDDVRDVERVMVERQVRRVPIVDDRGCCIGIIAQADLALHEGRGVSDREVGRVVERVSEPSSQPRRTEPRAELR